MTSTQLVEIILAVLAGGTLTVAIRAYRDKAKTAAVARQISAEGESKIVDVAIRMAEKLEASVRRLEERTEELVRKNLKLEQEPGEIRLSNINLLREVEALKRQNDDLERTCSALVRENTHLRVELDNCIKKEI